MSDIVTTLTPKQVATAQTSALVVSIVGRIAAQTADWAGGNVTHVPITGSIQAYVTAATAGDTLVLASGQYIITSTITINKQLNIVGQGNAGFLTSPVTAGHGTLISSTTASVTAFSITADNVRIANLSINLTGANSIGVSTAKNLTGLVLTTIDIIVRCNGIARGVYIYSSNAILRDVSFYVTSLNSYCSGIYLYNDASSTIDAVVDCYMVTGTVVGALTSAYGVLCQNVNDDNLVTVNLGNCTIVALPGTVNDIAAASISAGTSNSTVNCYFCTLYGHDWDAYQDSSNVLNVDGSVLVGNKASGTINYRTSMCSGLGMFSTGIGIGVTSLSASTLLEMSSTTAAPLLPRMTTTQRDALTAANGMLIYNTTNTRFEGYENGAWVDL